MSGFFGIVSQRPCITEWTDLNSLLGSGTKTRHITLKKDYTATEKDVALVVNGNV